MNLPETACEDEICPRRGLCEPQELAAIADLAVWPDQFGWTYQHTCAADRYPVFAPETAKTESPIEVAMLCALYHKFGWELMCGQATLRVQAALPRGYRADVLITNQDGRYVVECDGREFHENRQEQDRERDAFLKSHGFRVFRFSSAQIRAMKHECASRVFLATRRSRRAVTG